MKNKRRTTAAEQKVVGEEDIKQLEPRPRVISVLSSRLTTTRAPAAASTIAAARLMPLVPLVTTATLFIMSEQLIEEALLLILSPRWE